MKGGNEFSNLKLSQNAEQWLVRLHQSLVLKDYGKGTVRNYVQEMTLLFKYYHLKEVETINQGDIEQYLLYIKEAHKVGRAKCRSVAQSCSYFFKKVLKVEYIVPSNLYPKKQFILPAVMSEAEVRKLFNAQLTLKERCAVGLLYGGGMRISEICTLKVNHIESNEKRIKVLQGKGGKDRYTLLSDTLLINLRAYYIESGKPKEYIFTSVQTKRAHSVRAMQVVVNNAMEKAGFVRGRYTAHTLRHSFATHMLNQGNNIHVIKTLLGHSKLETTMIYLHLQSHVQIGIVSPLDRLKDGSAEQ